jgi:hypothetical protein
MMLENDYALIARKGGVHFIAKPYHLFIAQTERPMLISVQTDETITADRVRVVGVAYVRLGWPSGPRFTN